MGTKISIILSRDAHPRQGTNTNNKGQIKMAIDEIPDRETHETHETVVAPASSGSRGSFLLIFIVLAALAVGEFYSMHKITALRDALQSQQAETAKQLRAELQDQLTGRLTVMQRTNELQMDALKNELDAAANRMGKTGGELKRARSMVAELQDSQREQAEQLQAEIAQKADQQQVGALNQNVSAQRTDIDNTKKALDSVRSDLGMARSEMGTLIGRNHDDIEQLRKLGERDYFEFTATRKTPAKVAGVSMTLTKTNVKRHRFNLELLVDDVQVEKKDRTIDEPIFFYVGGSKRPYELVINQVKPNEVSGYLSTPKGAKEVAARSEGAGGTH
jgi:hypothetical protein